MALYMIARHWIKFIIFYKKLDINFSSKRKDLREQLHAAAVCIYQKKGTKEE